MSLRGRAPPPTWGWTPGKMPTGVQRSFTGAVPGSGHRSNLPNIIRAHMEGVNIDVLRRNRDVAFLCFERAKQLTWERAKVATRRYLDAWTFEARPTGAIVYNNAAHASMIEDGRPPGSYPPPERIADWFDSKAVRGLGGLTYFVGPRGGDWRRRQLIFQISQKIHDKGIPPEPIMKEAFREARQIYVQKLVHVLLHYNARGTEAAETFANRLRFMNSKGVSKWAWTDAGTIDKDFAEAWSEFQNVARPIRDLIEEGFLPQGSGGAVALPGRDY